MKMRPAWGGSGASSGAQVRGVQTRDRGLGRNFGRRNQAPVEPNPPAPRAVLLSSSTTSISLMMGI